jgi:hypothetical protein
VSAAARGAVHTLAVVQGAVAIRVQCIEGCQVRSHPPLQCRRPPPLRQ